MLLLPPLSLTVLRAQPAPGKQSVLILLRQPECALGKRLAELPASTSVPDEVRTAAEREETALAQAQKASFERRLTAAGATGVVPYPALNMMRADISPSALSSLHSDPAVVSVTLLSEDAQAIVSAEGATSPSVSLGVATPSAVGLAAGRYGRRSEALQPPSLMSNSMASGLPMGQFANAMAPPAPSPAFMPPMQMPAAPGAMMPGAMMPGTSPMMGSPSFGMPSPGFPGTGGTFQSILGVTGQMGMQAGTVMPRASGMIALLSGGAQIAQLLASSRKQGCVILLATAGTQIPETGGPGVIAVNAPPSCLWQAQSDAEWLQINAGGPMMGPGIVKYTAAPASAGMLRTGVISIAGVAGAKVKGKTSTTVRQGQ